MGKVLLCRQVLPPLQRALAHMTLDAGAAPLRKRFLLGALLSEHRPHLQGQAVHPSPGGLWGRKTSDKTIRASDRTPLFATLPFISKTDQATFSRHGVSQDFLGRFIGRLVVSASVRWDVFEPFLGRR
jgi:hypothetical protein